jgi:hypothetical protein
MPVEWWRSAASAFGAAQALRELYAEGRCFCVERGCAGPNARKEDAMRYAILAILGLCLVGLVGVASAQVAERLTMDRAIAQFGTPTYDQNCPDGSITLAWKETDRREIARLQPMLARSRGKSAMAWPDTGGRQGTRVMKFNATGNPVWTRHLR